MHATWYSQKEKQKRTFSVHTSPWSVTPSVSQVKPAVLPVMRKACPPPPLSALPCFLCSSNSGCSLCLECSSPIHAWFFPSLLETKQDVMGLLGSKAFLLSSSLSSKGQVQTFDDQAREEVQRQGRSSQETVVQPWEQAPGPPSRDIHNVIFELLCRIKTHII